MIAAGTVRARILRRIKPSERGDAVLELVGWRHVETSYFRQCQKRIATQRAAAQPQQPPTPLPHEGATDPRRVPRSFNGSVRELCAPCL